MVYLMEKSLIKRLSVCFEVVRFIKRPVQPPSHPSKKWTKLDQVGAERDMCRWEVRSWLEVGCWGSCIGVKHLHFGQGKCMYERFLRIQRKTSILIVENDR